MDLKGQYKCERMFLIIMWTVTFVAALLTFIVDDVSVMFVTFASGLAFSSLLCVPDWPFFNRDKLSFIHFDEDEQSTTTSAATNTTKSD